MRRLADVAGSILGTAVRRVEDPELITGRATYVGNLALPGALHLHFVRSPMAHAELAGIDTAAAAAAPGVVAVVVAESAAAAADAADLVEVDYTPLPAAVDVEEAVAPGAPLQFPDMGSN